MAVPIDALKAIASLFSIVHDGSQQVVPGKPVIFKLTPSSVVDLHATDFVPAGFELTWITRNVLFRDFKTVPAFDASPFVPSSVDALVTGSIPAIVPTVVPTPLLNNVGTQQLQGVPGQLAQLAGNIPIPVEVPVGVSVTWEVLDSDGTTVLMAGTTTFTAPNGTSSPEVSFVFAPQTVEMTSQMTIPTVQRFIRATIKLTAGTVNYTFTLPNIPVDVPAIPIPKVIVFFLHAYFSPSWGDDEGAAFIVVPNNSPLRSLAQLQGVLNTLQSTVSTLTGLAEFASFLLGLNDLIGTLPAQPYVQFRVADASNKLNNFNDVTLIQRSWYENDTEAEDELSSLIFIGPPGRRVQCFNDRDTKTDEGAFELTIGPKLHAIIRNLHSATPASEPDGNEINILNAPSGWRFDAASFIKTFGDELSSLSFP
ncbi:MAG TPA: hypothetical protein VK619_06820 [Pyrinomonadaceae bacterium]|nr:hypothetical protein [Pyrinomonadaceae bacterium]